MYTVRDNFVCVVVVLAVVTVLPVGSVTER